MFEDSRKIHLPPEQRPILIVVVDTEEEFDWSATPDRDATATSAIEQVGRAQEIFDEYGVRPCYVVDYPIVSGSAGVRALDPIVASGRCEIGAHLHPWVNPPYGEALTRSNMYPGNLEPALEKAKLSTLTAVIEATFGIRPTCYKAGRYGVGRNTAAIIRELGFEVDLSYCPAFDYRDDGGPDFSASEVHPFWIDPDQTVLEIPLTGAFVGALGRNGRHVHRLAGSFDFLRARGVLARTGLADRLMLSPEGYTPDEHVKLTRYLYDRGVRIFTWNFHSPSLVAGMTDYTRTDSDVVDFLNSFRRYFDYFLENMNGIMSSPAQVRTLIRSQS